MQMVQCSALLLVPWALACCVACNQRRLVLSVVPLQQAGELMVVLEVLGSSPSGLIILRDKVSWSCLVAGIVGVLPYKFCARLFWGRSRRRRP